MKHPAFLMTAFLALALCQPALAEDKHEDHHHAMAMEATQTAAALADGTVKKVDKNAGKLTVAHGPLPNGMPAMTMTYRVKNPGWLEQVKNGDRIHFVAENLGDVWTITRLEPVR